jgi:hypothetical protein
MLEKDMGSSKNKNMDNSNIKFVDNSNNKVMDSSNNKSMHNSNNQIMLCSTKEFLREHKHSGFCLAIIPKRIQDTQKKDFISANIHYLLKEFKEIVADALPAGLPPLRSISHQIKLIP